MRINDFHNILELIKQDILQSEAEYLKLLKVVGNNQKYDFRSQLSIYDKNPEATACAKFDYWREHFNRTVMRGQKGIPILEDYGTYKKVDYIFDISQTVSKNRDVNEVNLWRFDKEAHRDVLKEMIKAEGYQESESTLENIFSLSRLYGDEKIDSLMNELRISDEDKISFTKFARDSVSYAVASRFKLDYPVDKELLKENFAMLDSISLMSLGETVSDISGTVIDATIQKSKELELQKEVLRGKEAGYNKIKEELEEVEENVLRRDDQERISENERIFRNGEYGRDNRENQREYTESVRGTGGLHQGISESGVRSDETGLSFKQRGAEQLRDVSGSIQGEEADRTPDGYSETGDRVYESREAETDDGLEDRGREPSAVQSDDFSPQRNDHQGDSGNLKENTDKEIREADKASFSLPENRSGQIKLTIPLTQNDIDSILVNGGNHEGERLPIIAEFSKGKTVEELGEYLKDALFPSVLNSKKFTKIIKKVNSNYSSFDFYWDLDNKTSVITNDVYTMACDIRKNEALKRAIISGDNFKELYKKFNDFKNISDEFMKDNGFKSDYNCYCLSAKTFLEDPDRLTNILRPILNENSNESKDTKDFSKLMESIEGIYGKKYQDIEKQIKYFRYFHVVREESQYLWETLFYYVRKCVKRINFILLGDENIEIGVANLFHKELLKAINRGNLNESDKEKINRRNEKFPLAMKVCYLFCFPNIY